MGVSGFYDFPLGAIVISGQRDLKLLKAIGFDKLNQRLPPIIEKLPILDRQVF